MLFGFLSLKTAGPLQYAANNVQTTHSVEDTVRHQIGGKLYYLDFDLRIQ